jgi:GTP-binding protein
MADIPGLIENASEGAGLGVQFLKHLERTRLLVHLVDVSGMTGRDPLNDFEVINRELVAFSEDLAKLPQVIVLSRTDILPDREALEPFVRHFEGLGLKVFPVSSVTGENVEALVYHLWGLLEKMPPKEAASVDGPLRITLSSKRSGEDDPRRFTVERGGDGVLVVSGKGIERVVAMTDMENEVAVRRLQRQLERWGVFNKLKEFGAEEGDSVRIRDVEFDYLEDEDPERAATDEEEEADAAA